MNNKVFYGEYSLKHWINLILKENIILPSYQRYFVWDKEKTEKLLDDINEKQFVPSVTIGNFRENGKNVNLILDGQQRLTSIFLAYIGVFPDKAKYLKSIKSFVDEDDNFLERNEWDNILEWNFTELTKKGNTKELIKNSIVNGNYELFELNVDDEFFENNYLGFSYLVPQISNDKEQQRFYSKVFRSINIQGVSLIPQESRAALYYLDKDLERFFMPEFQREITVNDFKIDFVRYLALLSQYKKEQSADNLAKGYARKMEKYYEEYIYCCVGEEESSLFELNICGYEANFNRLHEKLKQFGYIKKYDSIINVDVTLFGLIYFIVFEDKEFDVVKLENINKCIKNEVNKFKNEKLHVKNPSALKYLRERVKCSIDIYRKNNNE